MSTNKIRSIFYTGALTSLLISCIAQAAPSGSVNWNGWTFTYDVSGKTDGLSLMNVTYQNLPIIAKISFPVMRVFYDNNACGPYADRLGGTLSPIPWAGNATVAKREFTLGGRQWYEIGIRDMIGNYDIYQVYYLSNDGILDAHIYSKGMQCVVNHVHYPTWRIDFDVVDGPNDQIQWNTINGFNIKATEFNANATDAINHGWRVSDSGSGNYIDILPGFSDFTIPGATGVPVTSYAMNTVFGRLYKSAEDVGWTYGPNATVPYNNGESINNTDLVFWYEGYLPHTTAEGSELWHSTGLRLVINGVITPPPPPGGDTTQTFTSTTAITIPGSGKASPYPSTINVAGMSGVITKVIVKLNGLKHTYPDDLDILLVSPTGQKVMLMSDAGGSADLLNTTLTFDSSAASGVPNSSLIATGTYLPTNFGTPDPFSTPAPAAPYTTSLGSFNLTSPNGDWKLFVIDDAAQDLGSIASGWSLTITTN